MSTLPLPPTFTNYTGQTIKGYKLTELIGRGGFGAVYRAYQTEVEREVAIKIILPEYANNINFIKRFESEARIIAGLEHLHIVPLYDYWREPDSACLVMRLLHRSLRNALETSGAWEIERVARLLDQVGDALSLSHSRGVIHRDLKPDNILLDEQNNAYLADFGIAKKLIEGQEQVITDEDRFGSPAYISPEQIQGQPVSAQTDIYSLGVVLYMVLTGTTPFHDPSTTTVIRRHINENIPPLQTVRPDLPTSLNIVIWKATSKQPQNRYPDALSLAAEFRHVMALSPTSSGGYYPASGVQPAGAIASPEDRHGTLIVNLPPQPQNPYKGLRAFQEEDASDFYGRGTLIERLVSRMVNAEEGTTRFMAVVGPSGSGKSSVVRAGLIPAMRRGMIYGSEDWFYVQMTPGTNPFAELAAAILSKSPRPIPNLSDRLRVDERTLADIIPTILPDDQSEFVLLVDQFEEVFTLMSDEGDRSRFLNLLTTAISSPDSRIRVIVTLRADLYDRPLLYPVLGDLMRRYTEIVLPLSSNEMEQAVVKPVERMGMRFEPGVVAAVVAEVSQQPGALPLMEYALTELFQRRDGYNLTLSAYKEIGGVVGALARRADDIYNELDATSQEAARQIFLRLVTVGEGVDDTRRRILQAELDSINGDRQVMREVVESFGKYRLLTLDHEPGTRSPTVEVAHEALLREWSRLKGWINESREALLVHRRLAVATDAWLNGGRDSSFLAAGTRLAQLETLMSSNLVALNDEERTYLEASMAARKRAARRRQAAIAGVVVFALAALVLAVFAFDREAAATAEGLRADQQARISRSRELAVTALTGVEQIDLALLLSLEAFKAADTFEARDSLMNLLQQHPRLQHILHPGAAVRAMTMRPDGTRLAAGDANGTITLWDTVSWSQIGSPLSGHTRAINALAYSPDGRMLASGGSDTTVRLWDAETGAALGEALTGSEVPIWSLAFSPDGTQVVAGDEDGFLLRWDVATGELVGEPILAHETTISALAYSPDGTVLASASADYTLRLWNAVTGDAIGEPLEANSEIWTIAFSPDGALLVSGDTRGRIDLWDVSTGESAAGINTRHTDRIRSLAFNADGSLLVSASADNTLRLWDMESGDAVGEALTGHSGAVWSAVFDPASGKLISGGADGAIMLWDAALHADPVFGRRLVGHSEEVLSAAASPDGRWAASGGGLRQGGGVNNALRLWDMRQPDAEALVLNGHENAITGVAFSGDGALVASISTDGTARLWNTADGSAARTLTLPERNNYAVLAFSPAAGIVATGGYDPGGAITLWDAATGAIINTLPGHEDGVTALAFSADGATLASAGLDNTVRLWTVESGAQMGEAIPLDDPVIALTFSADGSRLALGSQDETVILWDVAAGRAAGQALAGHVDWVTGVSFSADGSLLASSSADGTVILWDMETGRRLGQPLAGHGDWVTDVDFSAGGRLISGDLDGVVIVWDTALADWQATACAMVNRNLTQAEWARYFRDEAYVATCDSSG